MGNFWAEVYGKVEIVNRKTGERKAGDRKTGERKAGERKTGS